MTKQLKKGLLTVLLFVMSICCAFSVNSFATVKADDATWTKFDNALTHFSAVADADLLKEANWGKYNEMYLSYTALDTLGDTRLDDLRENESLAAKKAVLDKVIAAYSEVQSYVEKVDALGTFLTQTTDYSTTLAKYEEIDADDKALDTYEKGFATSFLTSNGTNRLAYIGQLKAKVELLKKDIDEVIKAIKSIDYYEEGVWYTDVETFAAKEGTILLDSEKSFAAVEEQLKDITKTDIEKHVKNYVHYEKAQYMLNLQKAKAQAVIDMVDELKAKVDAADDEGGVYLFEIYNGDITLVENAYKALIQETIDFNGEKLNDLSSIVIADGANLVLEDIRDAWKVNLDKIAFVNQKTRAIYNAVETHGAVRLTEEFLTKITAAEEEFATLPESIKANDVAKYAGNNELVYLVQNYKDMRDARIAYDELDRALDYYVDALVAYDNAYKAQTEDNPLSNAAISDFEKLILAYQTITLTDDQISTLQNKDVNGEKWSVVYAKYQSEYAAAKQPASEFTALVNAIVYKVSTDVYNKIVDLQTKYSELTSVQQYRARDAKATLDALQARYVKDTEVLKVWRETVDALQTPIKVADFVTIEKLVSDYNDFSDELKDVAENTVVETWNKYVAAKDRKVEIEGLIKSLKDSIKAINDESRPKLPKPVDAEKFLADYAKQIKAMTDAKKALDDKDASAFESSYVGDDYRANYAKKVVELKVYEVEVELCILPEIADKGVVAYHEIISAVLARIAEINEEIAELKDAPKDFRNLDTLNTEIVFVNGIINSLVDWKAAVEDIVSATVEGYAVYQAAELAAVTKTYNEFEQYVKDYVYPVATPIALKLTALKALPVMSVADVKALLDTKQKASDDALKALEEEMIRLLAVAEGELNTIETEMKASQVAYNAFVAAGHEVNVDYAAFEAKLARLDFAKYFAQAVNTIAARVADEIYTFDDALMVDVLKAVYIASAGELQKLDDVVAAKVKLDELELVYDEKDLLDIDSVEDRVAVLEDAIKALDSTYATDEELATAVKTLNEQISAVKKFAEELKNNSATKEEMKAAYEELYNKILGVDEYFGKLVAEVEKTLKNSIEIVDAKAVKNADDIKVIFADIEAIEKLIGVVPEGSTVVAEIAAAKAAAIDKAEELVAALNDKLYKAEEGDIVKINAELVSINETIAALDSTYATDADVAEKLAALKTELETAIADAIAKEEAARKAADEALKADLKAAVAKLNKTITIITIILAIVSAACVGAIVYIFLKKRA